MSDFTYEPEKPQIHVPGAINQICAAFSSHENGLPEWVKNSAAAYIREGREPLSRPIVLFFRRKQSGRPSQIACLDLVGMSASQIERDFSVWADPNAATRHAKKVKQIGELGGHGNGGKCYMIRMFGDFAELYTVRNGLGCRYGARSNELVFGYSPNRANGRNFPAPNLTESLVSYWRENFHHTESSLPQHVRDLLPTCTGFTVVRGVGPKDWSEKSSCPRLIEDIVDHHQMITAIQHCQIYVVIDGNLYNNGEPLSLSPINPIPGLEEPKIIHIPDHLSEKYSSDKISTTGDSTLPQGHIEIRSSEKNMRIGRGKKREPRHTVTYQTSQSGVIGKTPMINLGITSSYVDNFYCDCFLDALDEYQQNNRGELSDSRLTRAVRDWISKQIETMCRELEERDRSRVRQEDKNELSRLNDFLDRWKNDFLDEVMKGLYSEDGEGIARITNDHKPTGIPARMELRLTYPYAGVGIEIVPTLKFYDNQDREIRRVPFRWISEDTNVAMVDEEKELITTFAFGKTIIQAETIDGKVKSNSVPLEVVRILSIRIAPHEVEMSAGTRRSLEALCRIAGVDDEVSNVYLDWFENSSGAVARVTHSGLVYGVGPGQTEITALDDTCRNDIPAVIRVTPAQGKGPGDNRGKGYPKILLSEIDCGPGETRPRELKRDDPPIYQSPVDVDNNVWWINLKSPFAQHFYNNSVSYGPKSLAWRMYHVERVIDILVQIALANGPNSEESLASRDWIDRGAELETRYRSEAIDSLHTFIDTGNTDEDE